MFQLVLHVAGKATGIGCLDEIDLRPRNAQEGHERGLPEEPIAEATPDFGFYQSIRIALFLERAAVEETGGEVFDIRAELKERVPHDPGGEAGGPMIIEGFFEALWIEKANPFIPETLGGFAELGAHVGIDFIVIDVGADSEHFKQVVKAIADDECLLEFKKCVLAVIDVDGMDLRRIVQQIVQGVASSAGDHDNGAVTIDLHELAVDAGIFPSAVIDEVRAVDVSEKDIVRVLLTFNDLFERRLHIFGKD